MKFYTCIAEYNPFHNGHLKHIEYMKKELNAEKIVVIMSGNFTQRGEPAILDKYVRAKHAIMAGADAVIELPTVFATANAEIFAKGAIKIINDLGIFDGICFGVESGTKQDYLSLASRLLDESKEFKKALKEKLDNGVSFAKAKYQTVCELYGQEFDKDLVSSPNNILGVEYTKALLGLNAKTEIFPMLRTGDHNDVRLKKGITSATSIRLNVKQGLKKKTKGCMPKYVYNDLGEFPFAFENMILSSLITTPAEKMEGILDCTEGLENRIKALAKENRSLDQLVERVSTKRYTSARVRRILISTLLGISEDLVKDCLSSQLYAKVLAVNNQSKDIISAIKEKSKIPLITRKSDLGELKKTAKKCFEIDTLALDLFNLATGSKQNENFTLFV